MSTLAWLGVSAACAAFAFVALATKTLYPHHRKLAGLIWVVGWAPLFVSVSQHQTELAAGEAMLGGIMRGHWPHALLVVGLGIVAYLLRVLFPGDDAVVPELDDAELALRAEADLAQLTYLFDKMDAAVERFAEGELLERTGAALDADDDAELRGRWAAFVEAAFELDVLQAQYRGFYAVDPVREAELHATCFLVAYGAYVCEYRASVAATRAVGDNDTVRTVLDEAQPDRDIDEDTFLALQRRTLHPDTLVRLNAGRAYLKVLTSWLEDEPVFARTKAYLYEVEGWAEHEPEAFLDDPLDYLERVAFDTWFPIQKAATKGLAAVHLSSRECFVTERDLVDLPARLEPGDALLMRREWHLTNLGIPGYWTHAAIYVGSLEELDAYFDGLPSLEGKPASEHLRERLPDAYEQLWTPDANGRPMRVLEAVTKGVRVATLEESGLADSLAGLRPRVPKEDKLRSILDGLTHLGKPYDFNFDFATDNRIVCSELVYKAYERVEGVRLEPEMVNGRLLLSPNALCEKLDADWEGERELEFVFFLDGLDHGEVIERDAEALRESHRRPKWHVLVATR